ncbi:His Kinase A domain containing protein [Mortierella sp. GBA43]|nr:His Kinase A domain containing protein [Mortierella sp. GBA43]
MSSKLAGTALAEKLSGFAQTVRGLRATFNPGGQSSPSSTCTTPTSPGFSPMCSMDPGKAFDPPCRTRSINLNKAYDSWDDFLYYYRQGQFPGDCLMARPKTLTAYPPTPPYMESGFGQLNFLAPPLPPNEEKRLRALHSFQILQTGIDPNFERIVQLVATVMGVAGCVITLVDHLQVSIKAQHPPAVGEVPREHSLCAHTILRSSDDPMIILDTRADWRFKNLPHVVSDPPVRFYAGAPLTTSEGLNIGALCLVDVHPRTSFSEKERTLLIDFAAVVMREMELWNDQVQLCIRNRMMRDVTRWVRGCLDMTGSDSSADSDSTAMNLAQQPLPTPSDISASTSGVDIGPAPALISPPLEERVFPTPSGSPTLMSYAFAPTANAPSQPALAPTSTRVSVDEPTSSGNPLYDRAFPTACSMIQATLDVDAVYLVQASTHQSVIPPSGSSIVWNYLDAAGRRKGSVGVVKGAQVASDRPSTAMTYLASSRKDPRSFSRPIYDEPYQHTKKQGSAWVCTDEGCRPHRLGDALQNATEPIWERDAPIIKEMLGYVRQELTDPPHIPGLGCPYTFSQGQDAIEMAWFGSFSNMSNMSSKKSKNRKLLCHSFQGTLPMLRAGRDTPYQSAAIVPILGPSTGQDAMTDGEPWAYFVVLSASRTKQISFHERIYLKNFGSCLLTEVQRRQIEAADKAKGIFIKSISHELRTPLHIILGILELLYASQEDPLSDSQLNMVSDAEAAGRYLIDTINNIIDLAKLDPDNDTEKDIHGQGSSTQSIETEDSALEDVDIRELCQKVADTQAKAVTDKNTIVVPSWTKPSMSSLSSASTIGASTSNFSPIQSGNGYASSSESLNGFSARKSRAERKAILELMVALDEPERNPDQDTTWSFTMDVKSITRILNQLVENAIKFTTTGFVEISAVPLTNSPISMTPPHPDAQAILFTVRDTGKGISADFVQSHLFKRFSQEDPLQVGTGLGMALVKGLIRKLGAWMEVWSEGVEGKGCVVKVLVWAKPCAHQVKRSLREVVGPWQDAFVRYFVGESTVGSERLFEILGRRMMGQQLNMKVRRGDEEDDCAEDMLKDFEDGSPCDLLVLNDDLPRLQSYISYWTDHHFLVKAGKIRHPKTPTPLLILVAPPHVKETQTLVDAYLETQVDNSAIERPASIAILTKPIGPIKLIECLRECFTPAFSDPGRQTPPPDEPISGSSNSSNRPGSNKLPPIPLIRSATAPNVPTVALGSRLMNAGSLMKQSIVYPMYNLDGSLGFLIPPHSPGGLVMPPRSLGLAISPAITPEHENKTTRHAIGPDGQAIKLDPFPLTLPRPPFSTSDGSKPLDPGEGSSRGPAKRSIKDHQGQKQVRSNRPTTTIAESNAEDSTLTAQEGGSVETPPPEIPLPRVLIVEDNITNRMILRTFLKKRGIAVVEAENGQIGVERYKEEVWRRGGKAGFEFVLMDLQMPVMDGNMATKRIREFEYSRIKELEMSAAADSVASSIPGTECDGSLMGGSGSSSYRPSIIFALTGLAGEEDKRLAFECGVDGYMTKPVSLKALGTLMANCYCLPETMEGLTMFSSATTKTPEQ